MGRWALGAAIAVLALATIAKIGPWVTAERGAPAVTPSLGGLSANNPLRVEPGHLVCVAPVPLTGQARIVQLNVHAPRRAQPLRASVTAPGYRGTARIPADYPVGYETGVYGTLSQPPPGDVEGRVCIRNVGERAVELAGTQEPRSQVLAQTTLDGRPAGTSIALSLHGEPASALSRVGTIVDRAAALTGLLPVASVWILLVLAAIGIPVAAVWTITRGAREDGPVA